MEKATTIRHIAMTIRMLRIEKGMTQEDFLFEEGIHIGRIEMGRRDIHISTLMAICQKMNITLAEFGVRLSRTPIPVMNHEKQEPLFTKTLIP